MGAPEHPWIEGAHAPVYIIRFPPAAVDSEVVAFCRARERWAETATGGCAWVADLTRLRSIPSSVQRRLFAAHLKRFEAHDVAYNRGSAIVVPSAELQGVVTAVFWISAPKFPHKAFRDVESALKWARMRLSEAP
jgi:hypothetical protein